MVVKGSFDFQDFTRASYRRLLKLAKANYPITDFADINLNGKFLLWRHDVDMSIQAAQKLAEIEAEEGVPATYFLLFHGHFYNLLEREIFDLVRRILALGHRIGLHFDAEFQEVANEAQLEAALLRERRWLEELFAIPIEVFSFHNPGPVTDAYRAYRYAGMINCYAEEFRTQVAYCSDSNGYWRYRRLGDVLSAATDDRLQVLTHPEWWPDEAMSPRRRVHRCIDGRADFLKRRYDAAMKATNRLNVSDD
jgi:hypothetical protein